MPPTEGKVDVHPTLNALVVSYDVETVLLSEYGEPMAADVKECRKVYVQDMMVLKICYSIFRNVTLSSP